LDKVTPADLGINITPDIVTGPPILYFYGTGLNTGFSGGGPTTFANTVYAYYDNLSWTKGRHTMKFGFFFSPYENNTQYDFYGNGSFSFFGPSTGAGSGTDLADFLFGLPDNYFQASNALSNIRSHQYAAYAQDSFKATRRLTLNLGVRYEYSEPKYDTQGRSG
jgi:outer membrane receptor protein involved in Fe transport